MKTISIQVKRFAVLFSLLVLTQGCTVYKSGSYSLGEAAKSETNTKLIMTDDEKVKFHKVIERDNQYYGLKDTRGQMVEVPIDSSTINDVKIKDKTASAFVTWTIPVAAFVWMTTSIISIAGL